MRKKVVFILIICSVIIIGGCGSPASSSTEIDEQIEQEQPPKIDEKLAHRFEQRGFEVEGMMLSQSEREAETSSQSDDREPTSVEKMAEGDEWTAVELVISEEANFSHQTIQYFEEDVYENYPPPKKNTIDAIATVMYESDSGFILDGLIRNGYTNQTFKKEQLQTLIIKLITANQHEWIVTKLTNAEGLTDIKGGEAIPFRLNIPQEKVRIPAFDYTRFSYYMVVQQPNVETKKEE